MLAASTLIALLSALSAPPAATGMADAVNTFLSGLTEEQRAIAAYPFDADERWNWHFVPKERNGISFHQLREDQYPLVHAILKSALSDYGYKTAETIRSLESVLREIEGPEATHRDPLDYHVTVFGTPAPEGTWALRYEGHHLSLNWTIVDGKAIASSPQFMGSNPGDVTTGPHAGTRALGDMEDLGRVFVKGLDEARRGQAIVGAEAPSDILTGNKVEAPMQEDVGIAYRDLTENQKASLIGLIETHARIHHVEISGQRLARVRKAGLDDVKFAWMGGLEKGQGHYYRIQGKSFLIEYDNTQGNANHVHVVWRDFHGDFGRDLLKEHYAAHDH